MFCLSISACRTKAKTAVREIARLRNLGRNLATISLSMATSNSVRSWVCVYLSRGRDEVEPRLEPLRRLLPCRARRTPPGDSAWLTSPPSIRCLENVSLSRFDSFDFSRLSRFLLVISALMYSLRTPSSPWRNLSSQKELGVVVVLQGAGEDPEVAGLAELAELLEEDRAVAVLHKVVYHGLDVGLLEERLQFAERDDVEREADRAGCATRRGRPRSARGSSPGSLRRG